MMTLWWALPGLALMAASIPYHVGRHLRRTSEPGTEARTHSTRMLALAAALFVVFLVVGQIVFDWRTATFVR